MENEWENHHLPLCISPTRFVCEMQDLEGRQLTMGSLHPNKKIRPSPIVWTSVFGLKNEKWEGKPPLSTAHILHAFYAWEVIFGGVDRP